MITKLSILNIQSHKNSVLEFHPGVNIIIGDTDSGKSAIIRSLRWIVWNRPSGSSLRSHWATNEDTTMVTVETDKGMVARQKHKGKEDIYSLFIEDRAGIIFKAFGTSVPEEIIKFLNINELNLQSQLDSHFLLSRSAGEVASHFNKVANLSKIDTATSNINGWIVKIKTGIETDKSTIKKNEEDLKQFDNLQTLEADIEVLEELEKRKTNIQSKLSKLYSKIVTYQNISNDIALYKDILELEAPVNNILSLYSEKRTVQNQLTDLKNLIEIHNSNQIKITNKSDLIQDEEKVLTILELYRKKNVVNKQFQRLSKALKDFKDTETLIKEAEQKYNTLHDLYEKEYPDVCPFCETKLK